MGIDISGNTLFQSKYLYLQAAGSTGNDGSLEGIHLRWELMGTLGTYHIPKGNMAVTNSGFNKPQNDFVNVYRSKYTTKYPVVVDLSIVKPSVIIDSKLTLDDNLPIYLPDQIPTDGARMWVFLADKLNTNDVVYIRFCDTARFDAITVDATIDPIGFIQAYGDGLMETWVKDKVCFACNIYSAGFGAIPKLKVESISVDLEDDSLKYVSCRKVFDSSVLGTTANIPVFLAQENDYLILQENLYRIYLENSPEVSNLILNGNFEDGNISFETNYTTPYTHQSAQYQIVSDAQNVDVDWVGKPAVGSQFMVIAGSTIIDTTVWKQENISVDVNTAYTFSGFLANLINCDPLEIPSIEIRIKGIQSGTTKSIQYIAPVMTGKWSYMELQWFSSNDSTVTIEIVNKNRTVLGNKFGLDNLSFTKSIIVDYGRVIAENIQKVRFTTTDCYLTKINLETYENYIVNIKANNNWVSLGNFGLSADENVVFPRLEKTSGSINDKWPKYKGAKVKIKNYTDRWGKMGSPNALNGLRNGIIQYVNLSEDPNNLSAQVDNLSNSSSNSADESISASYLDMLNVVSMDYHVARMMGLGCIDDQVDTDPNTEYIYVTQYNTIQALDGVAILNHIYATPPTKKLYEKLPSVPSLQSPQYGSLNKSVELTDPNGYTFDGKARFINLYLEPEAETSEAGTFFIPSTEFCSLGETSSVFAGLDYRPKGNSLWNKKVITGDPLYVDTNILDPNPEVCSIPFPGIDGFLFQHKETENGIHEYVAYSINWFSRPSGYSNIAETDATRFIKPNTLLPPFNVKAQIIQEESPRILTTLSEQTLLSSITGSDKTLIRLTFDYTQAHDTTYNFADTVELLFRTNPPSSVSGCIQSVKPYNDLIYTGEIPLCAVSSKTYQYPDINGNIVTFVPNIAAQDTSKYIGGTLTVKNTIYIIYDVQQPINSSDGAVFIVFSKEVSNIINKTTDSSKSPNYETIITYSDPSANVNDAFTVIENMANSSNWVLGSNSPNILTCKVKIGSDDWETKTETVVPNIWDAVNQKNMPGTKGVDSEYSQNVRGIWDTANVKYLQPVTKDSLGNVISLNDGVLADGIYEITFNNKTFKQHTQFKEANPVFWNNGVIRINSSGDPDGIKKSLDVLNIVSAEDENIKLLAYDSGYNGLDTLEDIPTGTSVNVNYYPGYKVYLYTDNIGGLTETNLQPATGIKSKISYIAARTKDSLQKDPISSDLYNYTSKVSVAATINAFEIVAPLAPEKPAGGTFATRPDFYNKATYSFRVQFQHEPFAVAFYRASERMILEALYEPLTIASINNSLLALGNDDFLTSRWQSLIAFEYDTTTGDFKTFPNDSTGYHFPKPDKQKDLFGRDLFVDPQNLKKTKDFDDDIKAAIYNVFFPLTEQPLIYNYIKSDSKYPNNKKPVIKDTSGEPMSPTNPFFEQSPMARKTGGRGNEILFTDFTLDGSSNNFYFYYGVELSNRMQFSKPSPISGPIQLVNTAPPQPPKIIGVKTQISDEINGVPTSVVISASNYLTYQKITKFSLYRAIQATDAISVRNMTFVKELDLETNPLLNTDTISIIDDFTEDTDVPYGEPLYYKLIALRKVNFTDNMGQPAVDFVPSEPSRTVLANIVDNVNPIAPLPVFSSDPITVSTLNNPATLSNGKLSWNKVTHNATYYIYQMSENGNWNLLGTLKSNTILIEFPLDKTLVKTDLDGNTIYYRFKVDVENSSGLFNLIENAITV